MEQYWIVGGLGIILALVGGAGGTLGTTNTELFVLYVVLMFGSLGLIALSKKLRDQR